MIEFLPFSTNSSLISFKTTSYPFSANTWAMPLPIVPEPTTIILLISITFISSFQYTHTSSFNMNRTTVTFLFLKPFTCDQRSLSIASAAVYLGQFCISYKSFDAVVSHETVAPGQLQSSFRCVHRN